MSFSSRAGRCATENPSKLSPESRLCIIDSACIYFTFLLLSKLHLFLDSGCRVAQLWPGMAGAPVHPPSPQPGLSVFERTVGKTWWAHFPWWSLGVTCPDSQVLSHLWPLTVTNYLLSYWPRPPPSQTWGPRSPSMQGDSLELNKGWMLLICLVSLTV